MTVTNFLKINTIRLIFVSLTLLLLMMAVWVYQSSAVFVEQARQAKEDNIRLVTVAQQMRVDVIQIQQWLTDISATRAQDGLDDGFAEAENSYLSFLSGLEIFEQFYAVNKEAMLERVMDLKGRAKSYYGTGRKMAQSYIDEGSVGGNQMMVQFDQAAEDLYQELNPFIHGQGANLSTAMDAIVDSATMLKVVTIVVFSAVFLIASIGLYVQGRKNKLRLDKITQVIREAADGDLTVSMGRNRGQLVRVSLALNDLFGRFSQVIQTVKTDADFVYNSAEQISDGNENLSLRMQEQASSLEEAASSMEEMTSTIKHNTDSANEAHKLVNATREEAEKGRHVVDLAVSAMGEINSSSNKIADIIGTIDAIAFQTNLLALNAAVEAARAGDQGRGFAVVASEVRVLAQRSADAAKEIKALIEESVDKVRVGTQQVDESGSVLRTIIDGIKKVSDLVTEINHASQEQSTGIDEVGKAVAHIDERLQQNAAFVEQSSAASKRMKDQAALLNDAIAYFKLGDFVESADNSQPASPQLLQHS